MLIYVMAIFPDPLIFVMNLFPGVQFVMSPPHVSGLFLIENDQKRFLFTVIMAS